MTEAIKEFKNNSKRYLRLYATGLAMGTADLIPGVSGGTIAFLSGIYEELIYSIKLVTGDVMRLLIKGKIVPAFKLVPFKFLVPLAVGLFSAILLLANLFSYLLKNQAVFVWAFFFGLVLASVFVVLKRVVKWDLSDKVSFVASAVFAYFLVGLVPVETPATPVYFFVSGMIAISAMILPGISGSFILLLMGKYQQVLTAVTERDLMTLFVFATGCIVGIAVFARVLSWLFKKHHDISVAVLAGFMLGSIQKIWPFKEVVSTRVNSHGEVVPFIEKNVLPQSFDASVVGTLFLFAIGVFLVFYLDKKQVVGEQVKDVKDQEFVKEHKKSLKDQ
jgi:putative membrane protein